MIYIKNLVLYLFIISYQRKLKILETYRFIEIMNFEQFLYNLDTTLRHLRRKQKKAHKNIIDLCCLLSSIKQA